MYKGLTSENAYHRAADNSMEVCFLVECVLILGRAKGRRARESVCACACVCVRVYVCVRKNRETATV